MPGHWEFGYFDPGLVVETTPPAGAIPFARTLHTWGSLPWGVGVWLGGTSGVPVGAVARVSGDADFLGGLIHRVAIEMDVRASGALVGARGSSGPPDWDPLTGLDDVACRIGKWKPGPVEGPGQPGQMTEARVLFGREIVAGRGYRLVRQDPFLGPQYYYLVDRIFVEQDDRGVEHHWVGVVRSASLS